MGSWDHEEPRHQNRDQGVEGLIMAGMPASDEGLSEVALSGPSKGLIMWSTVSRLSLWVLASSLFDKQISFSNPMRILVVCVGL